MSVTECHQHRCLQACACSSIVCKHVVCITYRSFQQSKSVSVFEFNIRFLGGLLSAFALTKDEVGGLVSIDLSVWNWL